MIRTTVTLESDALAIVKKRMRERGVSFKQAVNDAIRQSVSAGAGSPAFSTSGYDMGIPRVNLDRALRLAGELEDEDLLRKLRSRK